MPTRSAKIYRKLTQPLGVTLENCPVCGADAELIEYAIPFDCSLRKLHSVMCSNGEGFEPSTKIEVEGCLLFYSPEDLFHSSIVEAIGYWNEYAKVLEVQRQKHTKERVNPSGYIIHSPV